MKQLRYVPIELLSNKESKTQIWLMTEIKSTQPDWKMHTGFHALDEDIKS